MTATERKEQSEKLLATFGIPIPDELPPMEEEDEVQLRTPQEIAARITILTYLSCISSDKNFSEPVIGFLKQEELWEKVTEVEKGLFAKTELTEDEITNIQWRGEAMWLMLWVINKVDVLDLPVNELDARELFSRLPGFMASPQEFIRSATIRPVSEILDQADLIFRLVWVMRKEDSEELNEMTLNHYVAYQRHYAVSWITCLQEWDEDGDEEEEDRQEDF